MKSKKIIEDLDTLSEAMYHDGERWVTDDRDALVILRGVELIERLLKENKKLRKALKKCA